MDKQQKIKLGVAVGALVLAAVAAAWGFGLFGGGGGGVSEESLAEELEMSDDELQKAFEEQERQQQQRRDLVPQGDGG